MAILEKIRSKSVLLLIIIGVALVLFILTIIEGPALRSLFGFDDNKTVAKVGGDKIEAAEYQNRLNAVNANGGGETDEERAWSEQQLLRQMIYERLQNNEYDKLGLIVTDEELNDAIFGSNAYIGYFLAQRFIKEHMPFVPFQVQTAVDLSEYCDKPEMYGENRIGSQELQNYWLQFEEYVAKSLLELKFNAMLAGTMTANKLDVEQMYKDANTGYTISYVKKSYTPDPSIKVTDDEIKALWEADKAHYSLDEENRLVGMIALPIVPSPDDEEAARKEVDEVLAGLNSTDELEALHDKKGFNSQRTTMTLAMVSDQVKRGANPKLKEFAENAAVGSAMIIEENPQGFQLVKLLNRDNQVDSLTINVVLLAADNVAMIDSVKMKIAEGKSAADLMALGDVYALDSIATSLTNPNNIGDPQLAQIVYGDLAAYKDAFLNAELGNPFQPDSTSNANVVRLYTVVDRNAPEPTLDMALIEYPLHPSKATIDGLRARLEKFVAENPTAEKFVANAAAANLQFDYYDVTPSNPYVQLDFAYKRTNDGRMVQAPVFLPSSNEAAVWALESSKGSVSPVFGDERTGAFVVAAVNDVFKGYRTIADPRVKSELTAKARNSKTGDAMIKQYNGKATDVEGYAGVMESDVATDHVNFNGSVRIYGPELVAKIVSTPEGKFVGPTKGEDGVFVYQVTEINNPTRPVDMKNDGEIYNMRRGVGAILNNPEAWFRLFLGDRKIDNHLYKVFKN